MANPETKKYCEYAVGHPSNRGSVIDVNDFDDIVESCNANGTPLFRSLYDLDESALEHFKLHKTIKGYQGIFYLPELILDIDKAARLDNVVFEEAYKYYSIVQGNYGVQAQMWYSGTGYHIIMRDMFGFTPSKDLPAIVKATMGKHFPGVDHVYDNARLIRAKWTKNEKSGRYKVLVPFEMISKKSYSDIIVMASKKPEIGEFDLAEPTVVHTDLIVKPGLEYTQQRQIHLEEPVTNVITCMQKAYNAGEQPGTRHDTILRMAAVWRKQGIPLPAAIISAQAYAPGLEPNEVERLVRDCYARGYSWDCSDPTMAKWCDQRCIYFNTKNYGNVIVNAETMERDMVKFVRSADFSNAIDIGKIYTLPKPFHIYPGEFVVFWGDTKLGKSAFVQNLCTKWTDKRVMYMSLEVPQNLMYRRFLQIANNMTKEQIYQHYLTNTNSLSGSINHISMVTSSPNLDDVAKLISESSAQVIVVDTLDGVIVPGFAGRDDNAKTSLIANRFKDLAQRMNIILLAVHHVSKGSLVDYKGNDKPLSIHSGKNSSAIEQKADKVIGIEGKQNDPMRTIRSLGARDEFPFDLRATFNADNFRFTQIL